jgi:hypothetical protein
MYRWVKPNFVSGGAVPLSIYGKVRRESAFEHDIIWWN